MATFEVRDQKTSDELEQTRVEASFATADSLIAQGRWRGAIDVLTEANRARRNPKIERRLVQVRLDAFAHGNKATISPWPPITNAPIPNGCPPEVSKADLDVPVLIASLRGAGSLLVRRLIPPKTTEILIDGIDRAFAAFDASQEGRLDQDATHWFEEFQLTSQQAATKRPVFRTFLRSGGGIFAADSPPVLFDLLEAVKDSGITDAVTAYLGEPPALSAMKTILRRVPASTVDASWHQDGAFMGTGIRSVNVWLALTRCGEDAPGLDILPRRLDHLVETGTEGAIFDWAASSVKVEEAGAGVEVCRPLFEAGDGLLFDHFFMHRTAADSSMTLDRHGIEMWFFAPSRYPENEIPLVV
jgi:hypothetical protein